MNNHNIYDLLTMNISITARGDVTLGIVGKSQDGVVEDKAVFTCTIEHSNWDKVVYEIKNDLDKASYIPRMTPYTNPVVDGVLAFLITKNHLTLTIMPLNNFDNVIRRITYIATDESRKEIRQLLRQNFISWFNGDYKIISMKGYRPMGYK